MINLTPWILLLPLVGFIIIGLFGRRMPKAPIALIGCGVVLAAFVLALIDFVSLATGGHSGDVVLWHWVAAGTLHIDFGLLSDQLSAIMLLVVTGVGFLIHVYSIGYMADDESFWRFFSFLNLFIFAMTLLVTADNFLFLLIGWGGVGLASFLLIGFWYTRPSAVAAARKAFVVNVIGDVGLMIAIYLLFKTFGTLAYGPILYHIPSVITPVAGGTLTAITLLLFVAAAAKSAQLPLHVWLPDAMEGPTPVSALIHAATMVTAGVYLVARAAPLFSAAPGSLAVVGGVAGVTALFAATIACVQTDIKRVLAYSTMSQIGYMFMGEAVGGYTLGIFHLTTHAFFKALLFMCAGAVMHALGGEQDMRKMGGLRRKLPLTYWSFIISGLALAAIVPFAGFWSKDAILGAILYKFSQTGNAGWLILWLSGLLTAILTGFYIFRLIFGVFHGSYRGGEIVPHGAHDAAAAHGNGSRRADREPLAAVHDVGPAMSIPMVILAVLSVIGGFDGVPWADKIGEFLAPVTGGATAIIPAGSGLFWLGIILGLACGIVGIIIAWFGYGSRQPTFTTRNALTTFLENRYYIDTLYDVVIVRPIVAISAGFRRVLEGGLFDGGSRGVGGFFGWSSGRLRALQTGYARNYALAIFLGAMLILLYYVIRP